MTKSQNPTTGTSVSYDSHAILINGKRLLFISAAIHYPRSTPAMWPKMMRRAKDAGINCIETYIFWNLHERVQGKYDFTHNLDFLHFIQCAHDIGLYVIVRIGPYICAETNYGGFPGWLRDAPGVENIRTNDEPFKKEMEKWVRLVGDMLRPTLAPNGGPVILLQIENEYGLVSNIYGEEGQKYLAWTIQLAHSLEMNVPWIMCMGSMPGAIDTINSFYGHTHIEKLRVERPDQPMIWTENWPGWCDVWTNPHRSRTAENVAYGSARFLAQGGTGINYYMYHGGTNFGVCSSYLQTTSYDYGAPLDEFGFVATKYKHLASFHKLIWKYSDLLLSIENSPKGVGIGENCLQFTFSDILSFICNDSDTGTDPVPVKVHFSNLSAPVEYLLPGRTVLIVDAKNGEILYDSSKVDVMSIVSRSYKPSDIALEWKQWAEPFPDTRPSVGTNPVTSETPVEMLGLTKDLSDYTWYSVALPAHAKSVTFNGIGDVAHVFVDHEYVASTKEDAIKEDRTPIDGADFIQEYNLPTRSTAATLNVLVSALGLIRGPGNVGNTNTVNEKKGIWGPVKVQIEDAEEAVVLKNWTVHPFLVGEHFGLDTEKAGLIASILPTTTPSSSAIIPRGQPRWYISAPFDVSLDDEEVGFSLNMNSMYKGAIFINGRHAGRHFITPTFPSADFWVKHFGDVIVEAEVGPPIQTRYHLPREWFKAMGNILVILEEGAKDVDIEKVNIDLWVQQ
ncbi:hypothetical protein HK100_007040 [Physocladia obscura]|uniref:Beta-galactosidase n=1 Tax=Physocladia obscura TaxID=109957 RepID=A0AAD5SRF9_9FUNG|nr:hypothetical protein HK100_007040 [Physocladia obscura]